MRRLVATILMAVLYSCGSPSAPLHTEATAPSNHTPTTHDVHAARELWNATALWNATELWNATTRWNAATTTTTTTVPHAHPLSPPPPPPAPSLVVGAGSVNGYPCGGNLPPCSVLARESGGNPLADNPTSSACGLWQFITGTWNNFAGYPTACHAPPDVQNQKAILVWDGGNGCSHWSAC